MGGNAIALVGWAENSSASGMIGKIYICKKKPFHVHACRLSLRAVMEDVEYNL